ncbi:hypothetical protein [Intrasporangium sp.]|uniref:hypothetical protein n=1 Tax=Intrasporangium sp. TaxID=1925024 RepID=UPI00293A789A|nr:hypothetical protein [Intrasporangium sp.]MDV3220332.1 hypothetical protein [Intrasporangium sp.]
MATDPLAGTDLARIPLPDDVYGFGWAELRYLLGRHRTPSAQTSVAALGFGAAPTDDIVPSAGIASLMARGLVAPEGDHGVSRGEAAVLETVFARGQRWSGLSFRTDASEGDLLVAIEDGDIIALLQPRSYGTWFAALNNEVDAPAAAIARAVEAMLDARGSGRFAIETRTLDGVVGARFFRPDDGGWLVSDTADGEQRRIDRSGLVGELAALLPGRPGA